MSIPNHQPIIAAVLARFTDQIEAPVEDVDAIGRRLLPHFIEAMPDAERPNWGVLEKRTSNPYSVPYDILVWQPTKEHFDCLTSDEVTPGVRRLRARWANAGVLPKSTWHWCRWQDTQTPIVPLGSITPEPQPEPEPPPQPQPPDDDLKARVAALEARVNRHLAP